MVEAKLAELGVPGGMLAFSPDEAETLGAFLERALDLEDALDTIVDLDLELAFTEELGW